MEILGVDIGGTGIKGAIVDTRDGKLLSERFRLLTPHPAKPDNVCDVVSDVVTHFSWTGPIGCTFPAIVHNGTIYSAANVHKSWINQNGQTLIQKRTNCPVVLLNDADAAGIAEMKFGAGRHQPGLVIMLTFGTGVGSALFWNGQLVPNAELGHLELRGKDAEKRVSDFARQKKKLNWKQYARRLDEYLKHVEFLFSPDLIIVGGGASKDSHKFLPRLHLRTRIVPAELLNEAGIIGAALAAEQFMQGKPLVE